LPNEQGKALANSSSFVALLVDGESARWTDIAGVLAVFTLNHT
jgi:hypothetical protein